MAATATQSPPDPPQSDLNAVYRPYEDTKFQEEVRKLKTGDDDFLKDLETDPVEGGPINPAELFGDDLTAQPVSTAPPVEDLLNLDARPAVGNPVNNDAADLLGLDEPVQTAAASSCSNPNVDVASSAVATSSSVAGTQAVPVGGSAASAQQGMQSDDLFGDPFAPTALQTAAEQSAAREAAAKAAAAEAAAKAAAEVGVEQEFAKLLFADGAQAAEPVTQHGQQPQQQATLVSPSADGSNTGKGLLEHLPPGVVIDSPAQQRRVLDLSGPADDKAGEAGAEQKPASVLAAFGGGAASSSAGAAAAGGHSRTGEIPKDAKGFGSEDLFGKQESNQPEFVGRVIDMLPAQIKQHVEANTCMKGGATDTDERFDEGPARVGDASVRTGAASSSGVGIQATELERQHVHKAVDRACEGRWVPTYMRHQMAEHGHTAIPTQPNAHEYNANGPAPTIAGTFEEMGQELGETAQNMINFVLAVVTSLAFQCQMCTHNTATTVHDRVIVFGENLCNEVQVDRSEDDPLANPLPDEATAGYGPMRSRVGRSMKGVSFERLIDLCRRRLMSGNAPADFQRTVKAREICRQRVSPDRSVEDWIIRTEVNPEVLPKEALEPISSANGQLLWRERWRIEPREQRASVEITNEPASPSVSVVCRIDIQGSSADGGTCEVDSRLFARPQDADAVLPLGLVEQLFEAHHQYSELLRDLIFSIAADRFEELSALAAQSAAGASAFPAFQPTPTSVSFPATAFGASTGAAGSPSSGAAAASAASSSAAPLPVVGWPVPEKRPPSWAADGPRAGSAAVDRQSGMDSSFLMKVADGI